MYTTGKELKEIAKAVEKDPEWVMHLTIISLCSYLHRTAKNVFLSQLLPKYVVRLYKAYQ